MQTLELGHDHCRWQMAVITPISTAHPLHHMCEYVVPSRRCHCDLQGTYARCHAVHYIRQTPNHETFIIHTS
jgi:hypothetical protein